LVTHSLKPIIIVLPVHLEIKAEIQNRLTECAFRAEQERDEQSPQAAIAVQKRMDGFELNLRECCFESTEVGSG
jgi:hypothetical protein